MPLRRVVLQGALITMLVGAAITALSFPYQPLDGVYGKAGGSSTHGLSVAPKASHLLATTTKGFSLGKRAPVEDQTEEGAASLRGSDEALQESEPILRVVKVKSGDTLGKILSEAGIDSSETQMIITTLRSVFNPRGLRPGQEMMVAFEPTADGAPPAFRTLSLKIAYDRDVVIERGENGELAASEVVKPLHTELVRAGGTIWSSLFHAADLVRVPRSVMIEMIRLFSFDVDFQRNIQRGDSFEVLFERYYDDDGNFVNDGQLIFATLTLSGSERQIYRYEHEDGSIDYYDASGRSARKALMRTPVDGARLSSRYGKRKHPVLGYTRMHRGIDFAAPHGTPIMAAGDGTIEMAGRNGGYGNYVRIRHNSEFSSAYAHLSRFAKGIRRGSRVQQGQIIGYVGSTGMSTGAHLHYEILRNGRQTNPLALKMPEGRKLEGASFKRFAQTRDSIKTQLAGLPLETRVASTEIGRAHV